MQIISANKAYEYAYNYGIKFPTDWYITKNFTWNEVFKNENQYDGIPIFEVFKNATEIGCYLQKFREYIKKPINIHCWVRQIPHNKRAGSTAKYSAHINGRAVDFSISGLSDSDTRQAVINAKLPVRIEKNTKGWVHIDISNYVTPFIIGLF